MPIEHAVYLDISGIQDYILRPRQLKLSRGASRILNEFNRRTVRDVARRHSRAARVVFSNGGNALVVFPNAELARLYRDEIHRRLRESSGIATVRSVICQYRTQQFPQSWQSLQDAMAAEKAKPAVNEISGTAPYWRLCSECGEYPAASIVGDDEAYCQACLTRWKKGRDREKGPKDFNSLGKVARPPSYIALVTIDLDRMGAYFDEHATHSEARCREVSHRIDRAVRRGVLRACETVELAEPLLVGGDDCAVMIPANRMWAFLHAFDRAFRQAFERGWSATPPPIPSFSSGIAIANSHYPISEFFSVAKDLQRSAKKMQKSKDNPYNSVDYEIIATSMSETPSLLRDWVANPNLRFLGGEQAWIGDGRRRTAKPYSLDMFMKFEDAVKRLKRTAPANKVKRLYSIAYQGPLQSELEYLRLLKRLDAGNREQVRNLVGPELWIRGHDGRMMTRAADVAELWEFV